MNILLLGATGYLGSRLTELLLNRGHSVIALKRASSDTGKLPIASEGFQLCELSDLKQLLNEGADVDCFINTACKYPRNAASEFEMFQANYMVPLEIFLQCLEHGVKKYLLIDTCLPPQFNAYAFAKNQLALTCRWYGERADAAQQPVCICNILPENFYGEDEPADRFIPSVIEKLVRNEKVLLTEGNQKRDFIYIGDVINAVVSLAENPSLPEYLELPLGTGEGPSIREVIEYLKEITDSESELCFGAVAKRRNEPDSIADCTKMQQYGIEVRYTWREGFRRIIRKR